MSAEYSPEGATDSWTDATPLPPPLAQAAVGMARAAGRRVDSHLHLWTPEEAASIIYRGITIPSFVGWCRISFIHSSCLLFCKLASSCFIGLMACGLLGTFSCRSDMKEVYQGVSHFNLQAHRVDLSACQLLIARVLACLFACLHAGLIACWLA